MRKTNKKTQRKMAKENEKRFIGHRDNDSHERFLGCRDDDSHKRFLGYCDDDSHEKSRQHRDPRKRRNDNDDD